MFDIKTVSVESLKAMAYDTLAQMENCQNSLKVINTEIASRNTQSTNPVPEVVETEKINE